MMTLMDLWLPIVLATVLVFAASSVIHMVVKWHNRDYSRVPGEDQVLDALRAQGIAPGRYMFPHCADVKELGTEENRARFQRGPVGMMTVLPNGMPNMGKALGLWALYLLLVAIFVAYVVAATLPAGSDYLTVFRVAGAAAFLPFVLANLPSTIWEGQPWSITIRFMIDGIVYSLVTAGTFAGFWPGG